MGSIVRFLGAILAKRKFISIVVLLLCRAFLPHHGAAASGPIDSMAKTFQFCSNAKMEIEWKEEIHSALVDKPIESNYRAIVRSAEDRLLVTRFIILDGKKQFVRNDSALKNFEVFQTSLMVEATDPRRPIGRVGLTLLS